MIPFHDATCGGRVNARWGTILPQFLPLQSTLPTRRGTGLCFLALQQKANRRVQLGADLFGDGRTLSVVGAATCALAGAAPVAVGTVAVLTLGAPRGLSGRTPVGHSLDPQWVRPKRSRAYATTPLD